ncbi:MAG: hypothetical protein DME09_03875 [Candidatus Rokuibacteriota bacterium]|nr:MAG: hypothetical protein DME09_03875 [Candidatus Rokubacteria bacterium]
MGDYRYPEFRWLEQGEGEPVLLLHGLMGRMEDWDDVLDVLALSCRPVAPLLPIFHPGLPETSLVALADHVVGLLDALDIPHAVIGGNSLGGHVALTLALARPERVSGLILAGSSGLFERGFTRGVPHRPNGEYVREKMEEIFYDPPLVTPDWVETVRRTVTDPARRSGWSSSRARRNVRTSREGFTRSRRRRSSCGAETTASRRPRSPSGSTH